MLHPCLLAALAFAAAPDLDVSPATLHLDGPAACHSLLVTARRSDGTLVDRTRAAAYSSDNPAVARVNERGVVQAISDGSATLSVTADGLSRRVAVRVTGSSRPREYH